MSKHRALIYGQPVPQSFLDAMQEMLGTMASPNLQLTMVAGSANQVQIVAGTASAQVGLGIDGLWRYITATINTTVSGSAGTYDIFVTTTDNSFATNPSPPPPETDSTNYAFAFNVPLLQGNVPGVTHYRKVGEAIWDGARILSLRQTLGVDGATRFQPGDLKLSAAAAPQAGWLLCDGSPVSRNTYAALYAALGGTGSVWGQGDGSTTFNLPDYRSRGIFGAGQGGGLTSRPLGQYGGGTLDTSGPPKRGEETHALSNAEMPQHNHGGATGGGTTGTDSPDHAHTTTIYGRQDFPQGSGGNIASFAWGSGAASFASGGASARHAHSVPALGINNDGGIAAHNNMPPYGTANVFIKT